MMRTLLFLFAVALGATMHPADCAAQEGGEWVVLSARMTADLTAGDGSALVTLSYVFGPSTPDGPLPIDRAIPLELLGFADATAEDVLAGGDTHLVLWPTVGSHRAAMLRPPFAVDGDTFPVEFSYRIERAVETTGDRLRGRVPILSGPPPRGDGTTGGFEATLLLPESWTLNDAFPSGMRKSDDGNWNVALPVVPAMVGFRATIGDGWSPGLPLVVDLLTITFLFAFAAFGWRHMREMNA
jgi:hypothetical protein